MLVKLEIYRQEDADPSRLTGKKLAIIGYGAQGRAHALNARDSGVHVIVGQRPGPGFDNAVADGFQPVRIDQACQQCDLINVLLPDEIHGIVYHESIAPHLNASKLLMACHGFSYTYRHMVPPADVDFVLVAPKGAGPQVRSQYLAGGGVPFLIATSPGASDDSFVLGLAYADALGGTRAGVFKTTIQAETETDLFGEQVVLCGGVNQLVIAAFETLVEAGYQPELAYFECLHELMLTVDLMHRGGLAYMRKMISNTAEYGDYSAGRRIVTDETKAEMKVILSEIQSGKFAKDWMAEFERGMPNMLSNREATQRLPIEEVGARLRSMMPWLKV